MLLAHHQYLKKILFQKQENGSFTGNSNSESWWPVDNLKDSLKDALWQNTHNHKQTLIAPASELSGYMGTVIFCLERPWNEKKREIMAFILKDVQHEA